MSKRIYQISTTAVTAGTGDVLMLDQGAGASASQITYANLMANPTAVGNSGTTATLGSLTATSATLGDLSVTGSINLPSREYAHYYWSASGTQTPAAATPEKIATGTAASGLNSSAMTIATGASANRITYTGTPTKTFYAVATFSIQQVPNNTDTKTLYLYRNGAALAGIEVDRSFGASGIGSVSMCGVLQLSTNQYVEAWLESLDGEETYILQGSVALSEI